jgi:hypothetical protein
MLAVSKPSRSRSRFNTESALTRTVTPHYRRADDEAHSLLRETFRASGDIEIVGNCLHVRLDGLSAPRRATQWRPVPHLPMPHRCISCRRGGGWCDWPGPSARSHVTRLAMTNSVRHNAPGQR